MFEGMINVRRARRREKGRRDEKVRARADSEERGRENPVIISESELA